MKVRGPTGKPIPEYVAWSMMKQRCYNPRKKDYLGYGARGITVFPEWRASFSAFFAHIGPRPSAAFSLDRIDNNRGYEPGNVRWALSGEQAANRRSCHYLEAFGRRLLLTEWGRLTGLARKTITDRIRWGWTVAEALSTPPLKQGRARLPTTPGFRLPDFMRPGYGEREVEREEMEP